MTLNTPSPTPVIGLLALWSDRHPTEFPIDAPPCDRIGGSASDKVLAAVFQSIALEPDAERRSKHCSDIALLHIRAIDAALNANSNRREELRQWFWMVLVLQSWNRAILEARADACSR